MWVSRAAAVVLPDSSKAVIAADQPFTLCRGRETRRDRVLRSQPSIAFFSSGVASARNFVSERQLSRSRGSKLAKGRPKRSMVKGRMARPRTQSRRRKAQKSSSM